MKKILFIVVLIIILAGAGTPLFCGLIMERVVKQSFDNANQMYAAAGSDVSIELEHYERHFSSSQIEWKIKLGALKALYGIEDIVLVDHAEHGFSGVVSNTSLAKNKWFTDFIENRLDGKNPVSIQTEYKFTGEIKSTVTLDAFSFLDGSDRVEIRPGQMAIKLDKGFEKSESQATWEGCRIPGKFQVDGLSLNSKIKKITPIIWDGRILFAVEHIKTSDGQKILDLSNFKGDYSLDFNHEQQMLSVGMAAGMDSIQLGQDTVKQAFARISIKRIDARGYEEFIHLYSQLMKDIMKDMAALEHDPGTKNAVLQERMGSVGIQMLGAYEKILKKGLEISILDFRAQLPQGDIKGDVSLSLKKDMTMARFLPIMMQPQAALDFFNLKSDITLPYIMIEKNPDLILPLNSGMQTGLFVIDKDHLVHKAETRDGKLFLNEKEVVLN